MSDFYLEPNHTLITGMTGSGKTTFVIKYLLNEPAAACRFIYDDLNRMWPRLKIPVCHTQDHLNNSLATQWSAFHPQTIRQSFKGDDKKAFRWWCKWVFSMASRGPGKKIVCLPEVWKHCNPDSIPPELALLSQAGREVGIELVCDTQQPDLLNGSLVGSCTEIVCFRLMDGGAVRALKKILMASGITADADQLCQQPNGSFTGFNRQGGARRSGRMF